MNTRPATYSDIPAIMNLERGCATAAHWTESQYQELFRAPRKGPERLALVAEAVEHMAPAAPTGASGVLGFLIAAHVAPEWELENLVVAPEARRMGLGQRLLDALISTAKQANSHSIFLEVRESNFAARALYEKAGFGQDGRRKGYYSQPTEDAILYRRLLS